MKYKSVAALAAVVSIFALSAGFGGKTENEKPPVAEPELAERRRYEPAEKVIKTETVYVNLKLNGEEEKITVVDRLSANAGGVYIDDVSPLKNIVNLKNDVLPARNGEKLRWLAPEADVYYGGETDKKPPVSFEIKYSLDGKNADPSSLAGKSGGIAINVKAINGESKEITVDGEKRTVFLPVLTVGGMILPEDDFTGVKVKNGRIIGDGSKKIVVFACFPGFSESYGIKDNEKTGFAGLKISDEATVEFKTDNFSLGNIYIAAFPLSSLNLDLSVSESVEDIKNALDAIKNVQSALNKIDPDGAVAALISNKEKARSIKGAINDCVKLCDDNKALIKLLEKYSSAENAEAIRSSLKAINDPDVLEATRLLSDPAVQSFLSKLSGIIADFEAVTPLLSELESDLKDPEVASEIEKLPETAKRLSNIIEVAESEAGALNALAAALDDEDEIIETLLESPFAGKTGNKRAPEFDLGGAFTAVAEERLKFGAGYDIFTGKAEGTSSSVAFVYKTPSIRIVS